MRSPVLTPALVAEIRAAYLTGTVTRRELVERFNVGPGSMNTALAGVHRPRRDKAATCCSRCPLPREPGRRRCALHLAAGRQATREWREDKVMAVPEGAWETWR